MTATTWGNRANDASGELFDFLIKNFVEGKQNDAALARYLELNAPVVSKVRHGKLPVGDSLKINIHKKTGLSIAKIEELIEA
jgi:hypothetical protein